MITAELADGDITLFQPFEGAKVRAPANELYDLFLRFPGETHWRYAVTAENRVMLLTCINYVRRRNASVAIKWLPKPKYTR